MVYFYYCYSLAGKIKDVFPIENGNIILNDM